MSQDDAVLWGLAGTFAVLSFFAIGGINPLLPEMQRQAVEVHGWMESQRFTDLFAVVQAAPGPNIMIVTLIGWDVGGLRGALAASLAMLGPTSVLAYYLGQVWRRFRFARWRIAVQNGLVPLTIGLVFAAGFVLAQPTERSWAALLVTLGTAVAVVFTRVHPLVFLAGGAGLGVAGLL